MGVALSMHRTLLSCFGGKNELLPLLHPPTFLPYCRDWEGAWRLGRIAVARPGEHMYESEFGGERGVSLCLLCLLCFSLGLWRARERGEITEKTTRAESKCPFAAFAILSCLLSVSLLSLSLSFSLHFLRFHLSAYLPPRYMTKLLRVSVLFILHLMLLHSQN